VRLATASCSAALPCPEPRDLAEVWEALDCVISETYRAEDILGGIREQIKKAPRQESLDLRPFQQVIKFV